MSRRALYARAAEAAARACQAPDPRHFQQALLTRLLAEQPAELRIDPATPGAPASDGQSAPFWLEFYLGGAMLYPTAAKPKVIAPGWETRPHFTPAGYRVVRQESHRAPRQTDQRRLDAALRRMAARLPLPECWKPVRSTLTFVLADTPCPLLISPDGLNGRAGLHRHRSLLTFTQPAELRDEWADVLLGHELGHFWGYRLEERVPARLKALIARAADAMNDPARIVDLMLPEEDPEHRGDPVTAYLRQPEEVWARLVQQQLTRAGPFNPVKVPGYWPDPAFEALWPRAAALLRQSDKQRASSRTVHSRPAPIAREIPAPKVVIQKPKQRSR